MHLKTFFCKTILKVGILVFCSFLIVGLLLASKSEAVSLGGLGGAIVGAAIEQEQIRKSLDYYENEGRNELFAELKKSEGVVNDSGLNLLLNGIMRSLTGTISKTERSIVDKPYNYFINPNKGFNAFCSLGHNVSVNLGVFQFFNNNEDQIAAVVAHELVHGQRNHPIDGAKKKLTVDSIKMVAGSQMGAGGRLAVGVVAANTKAVGITKPNEWEADNIAFNYITDTGYNPGAPAAVWQRVADKMNDSSSQGILADLLNPSTHPGEKERRDNYSKKLTEYSNNKIAVNAADGQIVVNGKKFMRPVAAGGMSGLERSYLIAGNLAAVFHNNEQSMQAKNENGTVKIGGRTITAPVGNDPDANELVRILNEIK